MSMNLLHVNATVTCPHGGQATVAPGQHRVAVSSQLVAVQSDIYTISGCPFTVGQKPQPCLTIRWVRPSVSIKVNGVPALLEDSVGLCLSAEQIPQGPPRIVTVQRRAGGR
ncbi:MULTISPECIES: hypothetical protein [unclassified Crossiella]|uniref:hypothetical protein n=1 Tax=unclassified Crossiella TaxID=2620835 RepID=UPI001FFFC182|nr:MULTISPECIES: hypothetical protein [unclassified Crossiella]MCK2242411.1 hypothetical protein [Crossiella sp. S99.2]MCK2254558.1 hypothetical protein [Crossiella sp. S99.1]